MIVDYATCEKAIAFFNNVYPLRGTTSDEDHYEGCSFYDGGSKQAYFNTHLDPDGTITENNNYGQICVFKATTTTEPIRRLAASTVADNFIVMV